MRGFCSWIALGCIVTTNFTAFAQTNEWQIGVAKVDITPTQPIRLSGYAVRNTAHTGIADMLSARAMVLSRVKASDSSDPTSKNLTSDALVLVSIDSIAVTSAMTVEIANWLEGKYFLPRSQLVISSSHSHATPHVFGGLNNLYRESLTSAEVEATRLNTEQMLSAIKSAITKAVTNRVPGNISIGEGSADFAVNRRMLRAGTWTGFGEQTSGKVDHRVRVLAARDGDGKVMGGAFLYACHCTTLGGDFNLVSGDWAGIAASSLEKVHPDAIFLPVIGCGADANPNPRGTYELAQQHAAKIVDGVESTLAKPMTRLSASPVAHFGYAGLAPEHPTNEALEKMASSESPNEKRWAEHMQRVRKEMGRLPETYPMPIHTWQFGDQMTWVFLGGEVVVEYQFQLEKELPTQQTWVAAYTDDVFAYVASEAMRAEGGYEVDTSMIYYLQPGRWQTGTQSLIVRRVAEIFNNELTEQKPLSADEALQSMQVPEGYRVEMVASEALVQDPINIAFGTDGRVWVVEMADYPLGSVSGRVKFLTDTDQDGRLDTATLFLDGLSYPTSVFPWQDGALIVAAPDIVFAADRDGDGRAEVREVWLSGIAEANPQHRASGFEIGLDGWLHFAVGNGTQQLHSVKNGVTYDVQDHDVAWNPTTGELRVTSGDTQFIRARDAFGNWFGNSNSQPIFQYVIESRYLDGVSLSGGPKKHLLTPATAPIVLPRGKTLDRFNDLFAFNRFTSACSSIISRVPGLGDELAPVGFVCEPVHNLVARIQLDDSGSTFSAVRHPSDTKFDFFTSTDPWSRPVRAINAPDGTIWIVDMVRRVIEHPEWIPTAWQERLNLRSGSELGRIYRVYRDDYRPLALRELGASSSDLLPALASENGALRDLALMKIIGGDFASLQPQVQRIAREHTSAGVRASALGCLAAKGWLSQKDLTVALADTDPRVVRWTLELTERQAAMDAELARAFASIPTRNQSPQVDLQWVLSSSLRSDFDAIPGLSAIAARSHADAWIVKALSLVRKPEQAFAVLSTLLDQWQPGESISPDTYTSIEACVGSLWKRAPADLCEQLASTRLSKMVESKTVAFTPTDLVLLSVLSKGNVPDAKSAGQKDLLEQVSTRARARLLDANAPEPERLALIELIGSGIVARQLAIDDSRTLLTDEAASPRLKQTVIETLRRLNSDEVAPMLLDSWNHLGSAQRVSTSATLLSRQKWTEALVVALETGRINPQGIDPATAEQLRNHGDRSLRSRCESVFGRPTERSAVIAQYLSQIPAPTITQASPKLFKEHCSACHESVAGRPMIGPPLENLKHWTNDQWVTAIMDPNRNLEPKYYQSTILTADGQVFAGIIQERTDQHLILAQADGSIREIVAQDVESIKESNISLMPIGMESKLSPAQLSELLGFLKNR